MNSPTAENYDGMLDAIAWMKATMLGDYEARMAIARNCDPVELVDALAAMHAWHLMMTVSDPFTFLDRMAATVISDREADS